MGIRQGGPLSSYLFILIADVLSRQISKEVEENKMQGIGMRRTCPEIHHLLFAEDSIILMKANERSARALRLILEKYSVASVQKVNLDKSCIQFGATCREEIRRKVKEIIGIGMLENVGKYLGFQRIGDDPKGVD